MATYTDHSILGIGGFGEVWRVIRDDGEPFAKKILNDNSADAVKRFQREVRILSKLDHPRIIRIVDTRLISIPYSYFMPIYIGSLRDELAALIGNEPRIAKIFGSILDGMHYAHQQGVIHRDLKPENVLMNNDDDVVISDFGLGRALDATTPRATFTGLGMGTVGYLSPEQAASAKYADHRTDIYTLGRILYEIYTGRSMVAPQDLFGIPVGIAIIISKCTKGDPDHRFQSVDDLRIAFEAVAARRGENTANERARELAARAITEGSLTEEELAELGELITRYQQDVDLLHEIAMQLPSAVADALFVANPTATEVLMRVFTSHAISQSWGYEYTDKIADACARLYRAIASPDMRALLVRSMVEVGVSHNRYRVMDIAAGVISKIQDEREAREVAHELINIQDQLLPIASRLTVGNLHPALKELFQSVM